MNRRFNATGPAHKWPAKDGESMMGISEKRLEALRKQYPAGCRVMLDEMDDMQAPPAGTAGTVIGVDDTGSIMVSWDTGGSLHVLYGVDRCHRIDEEV